MLSNALIAPAKLTGLAAATLLCTGVTMGQTPNVRLQDIGDVANFGTVGSIRAYAIGSNTCNVGTGNLIWANSGTPAIAMNAFRLYNGRLEQIGQGWCKHACCAAAGNGCGQSCNGVGGNQLGAGCLDVYGGGYNGGHFGLGPRSGINPWSGTFAPLSGAAGTEIAERIQVATSDLSTTTFPGAIYFVDGVYVAADEPPSAKGDNATYKRVSLGAGGNLTPVGAAAVGQPAIYAWRAHGGGAGVVDPTVRIEQVDAPGEGRYFVASKSVDAGGGRWRYEYAVYNLNSHAAGGSLFVPASSADVTDAGFRDVPYHSGEPYSNTDWVIESTASGVLWRSPQTFAENPNSNALRWGTMYNFWFTSSRPPADIQATLSFFRPFSPGSIQVAITGPGGCAADFNGINGVSLQDLFDYLGAYFGGLQAADRTGDTFLTVQDVLDFLADYFTPCE